MGDLCRGVFALRVHWSGAFPSGESAHWPQTALTVLSSGNDSVQVRVSHHRGPAGLQSGLTAAEQSEKGCSHLSAGQSVDERVQG